MDLQTWLRDLSAILQKYGFLISGEEKLPYYYSNNWSILEAAEDILGKFLSEEDWINTPHPHGKPKLDVNGEEIKN